MSIKERLTNILSTLPEGVKLVAVSKFHPAERLQEAYDAGQRIFGESRPQEMAAKQAVLPSDIEWHMIAYDVRITPEFDGLHGQSGMLLIPNGELHQSYAIPSAFGAYVKYL